MRHFSIELLKESPSPALQTCARLAQLQVSLAVGLCPIFIFNISNQIVCFQPFVGRELFAASFVSCWTQLTEPGQKQLVRSLEMAFSAQNIPLEILATLLNLVLLSVLDILVLSK